LRSQIKKKQFSDETVASLLQIPKPFYSDDNTRLSAIQFILGPYDQARLDTWAANKPFAEVVKEGTRIQKFYQTYNIDSNWLIPQIEQFAIASMKSDLDKNDLAAFAEHAKAYEQNPDLAGDKSKAIEYINTTYASQLKTAEQLSKEKKYEQAIAIHQKLNAYRDASKAIQQVELRWSSDEPVHLLRKVESNAEFSNIITGSDKMGAIVYTAGITKQKLVLARMLPDFSVNKMEVPFGDGLAVKSIRIAEGLGVKGGPAILIEGGSSSRKFRYVGFEAQTSGLKKILDVEADSYRIDKPGSLIVANTTGNGAGQESYFNSHNGAYAFAGIKPDYVEISLSSLLKYKNTKVRFKCTILTADANTAVVALDDAYVLLRGKTTMRAGSATITGTWTSTDSVKKGAQSIPAYIVDVSSVTQ